MLLSENLPTTQTGQSNSLVRASLDIGRVLADRDGIAFRAQGACMYPAIRPGDVLRIHSRSASDVVVGDIAVCRRPGYLFGHRVIAKGEQDGHPFIVTRPDRSPSGSDGPTFDDDLLGVVIEIERNGRRQPLTTVGNSPWYARCYYAAHLAVIKVLPHILSRLSNTLVRMQNSRVYRFCALGWLALKRPARRYSVQVAPNERLASAVHRQFAPDEFNPQTAWPGRIIERWTLVLHLDAAPEPAGWLTFAYAGEAGWQIEASHIRVRYRGMGFQAELMQQAGKILARSGHA